MVYNFYRLYKTVIQYGTLHARVRLAFGGFFIHLIQAEKQKR